MQSLESSVPIQKRRREACKVLTTSDFTALAWVAEQGALNINQLWKAAWYHEGSRSPKYTYDRVNSLVKAGFLEKIRNYTSSKLCFRLTTEGHQVAINFAAKNFLKLEDNPHPVLPKKKLLTLELSHAELLTDLRLHLMHSNRLKTWVSDRVLSLDQAFQRSGLINCVPDAIWITKSGRKVAIEYERTQKTTERTQAKIRRLENEMKKTTRVFDLVLWIAEGKTHAALERLLKVFKSGQKLRTLKEFLEETT